MSLEGCTVDSDPTDISIDVPTSALLTGSALVKAGQTAYLPISFAGPAPWSVTLTTGQKIGGITQNPYFLPVTPTTATTYALAAMSNACGTGTASGNAVVTVGTGQADLSLDLITNTRVPVLGEMVSFSAVVSNAGPDYATGVQLQSRLPDGLSFAPTNQPGVSYDNGVVSIAAGSIPVNTTTTYLFQAMVTRPGTFVTAAQISQTQTPDPDSQPNSGTGDGQDDAAITDLQTIDQGPLLVSANPGQTPLPTLRSNQPTPNPSAVELSLDMVLDKSLVSVAQQEPVRATLTVRNRGGIPATSVIIQVQLPDGTSAPGSQSGWQIAGSQTLRGFIGQIPSGGTVSLQLQLSPTAPGTLLAQILDVTEPVVESIPGNGYTRGEKDEAKVPINVR